MLYKYGRACKWLKRLAWKVQISRLVQVAEMIKSLGTKNYPRKVLGNIWEPWIVYCWLCMGSGSNTIV